MRSADPVGTSPSCAINALPPPLRQYIHDLNTRADPPGDVAELAIARDTCRALTLRVEALEPACCGARRGVTLHAAHGCVLWTLVTPSGQRLVCYAVSGDQGFAITVEATARS